MVVNQLDENREFKDSVLGLIPKDWDVETIESCLKKGIIIDVQDGNHGESHPKNSDFVDDGVPFIMAKDLGNRKINIKTCHKITWKQYQSLRIGFAKPGDILLSHKGTVGLTTVVPDELHHLMLTPQVTYYRLSEDSTIVKRFLFYFIQSCFFQNKLEVLSAQSTRSYIGIKLQKTLQIIIPPIPEQQKIAKILDTVDKAIAQTETLIAKYKRIKTGLMQDLLTRGIDKHGQLRDPRTHKFKRSPLGMIPDEKDWICDCADSLCLNISVGIVIQPSKYYCEFGIPALRSANIGENEINTNELVFISERSNQLLSKSIIREGYVLTVRTGYPGTSAVVTKEFDGTNCIDVIISKPSSRILPQYLVFWINSHWGKEQVLKNQGGLAQQHFNVKEMKKLLVIRPGIDEQKRILQMISLHETLLKSELKKLNKLQKIKTSLMQDLLTGKTSVKPLLTNQP